MASWNPARELRRKGHKSVKPPFEGPLFMERQADQRLNDEAKQNGDFLRVFYCLKFYGGKLHYMQPDDVLREKRVERAAAQEISVWRAQ